MLPLTRWRIRFALHPVGGNWKKSMKPPPAGCEAADSVDYGSRNLDASRLWCDCSCFPQSHSSSASKDASIHAKISCRQLRKADKALRISAGPSLVTLAIQTSKSRVEGAVEVVAYQVRNASLRCQATAISGNARAQAARECSSSVERSSWLRKKRWDWPSKAFLLSSRLA